MALRQPKNLVKILHQKGVETDGNILRCIEIVSMLGKGQNQDAEQLYWCSAL